MSKFISSRKTFLHLCSSHKSSPFNTFFSFPYSYCSSSSSSPSDSVFNSSIEYPFTVNYLINSCGFLPEKAISASKHLNFKTPKHPDSVLKFFKNRGFDNTQVSDMVKRYPRILTCDPVNTILPKLEFFSSVGFSESDLVKIVTSRPQILKRSLVNQLVPSFRFFENFLQSDGKIISLIKQCPVLLDHDFEARSLRNIQFLRQVGVPEANIVSLFIGYPRALMTRKDDFRRAVKQLMEMGFDPLKLKFVGAVRAVRSISKLKWEKKVQLYKNWGLSEDEILAAFCKNQGCIMASEDKITRVMDFLVNKMSLEPFVVVKRPQLINLSLEKRILPRCFVYQVLLDKGLIKKGKVFRASSWLEYTESSFLNMIRKRYGNEAAEVLKLYQEKLDLASNGQSMQFSTRFSSWVIRKHSICALVQG